jgi:hypothetical protein
LFCKIAVSMRRNRKRALTICIEEWELAQTTRETSDYSLATVAKTFVTIGNHGSARRVLDEIHDPSIREWAAAELAIGLGRNGSVTPARWLRPDWRRVNQYLAMCEDMPSRG